MNWGYRTIFGIERGQSLAVLVSASVALLALAYVTLVIPEKAFIKIWPNDVFALLNGVYRVSIGQVPSVDFYSHYGPLIYHLPALALRFDLPLSAVFGYGAVAAAAPLMLAACLIMHSRFTLPVALLVLFFLFLQTVAPLPTGRTFDATTWAMYYNRQGWVATALVFLLYINPESARAADRYIDATVLASLFLFSLYTKVSFAAVILGSTLCLVFLSPYQRRVALVALGMSAALALVIEIFTGLHWPYFEDIRILSRVVPDNFWLYFSKTVHNVWVIVASFGIVLVASAAGRRSLADWLFVAFCVSASVLLYSKAGDNSGGLPALIAVFAVLTELTRRQEAFALAKPMPTNLRRLTGYVSCVVFATIFVSEPVFHRVIVWHEYYSKVAGDSLPPVAGLAPPLSGFLVPQREGLGYAGIDEAKERRFEEARLHRNSPLSTDRYMETVADGLSLLARTNHAGKTLLVLDHADPFTIALGLPPTPQGYPLLYPERGFSDEHHPPAEAMFRDVDMVLVPASPFQAQALRTMMRFYGDFLAECYAERDRSRYWQLLVPKPACRVF